MTREEFETILEINPQISGFEKYGKEPSLYDLIYRFYRSEFTHEESIKYTDQYINNLLDYLREYEQSNEDYDRTRNSLVCVNAHDRCQGSFPCPYCEPKTT